MSKAIVSWVTNANGFHVGLYWAYCYSHGFVVVFADHPQAGKIFMGRTLADAKKCAAETNWKK